MNALYDKHISFRLLINKKHIKTLLICIAFTISLWTWCQIFVCMDFPISPDRNFILKMNRSIMTLKRHVGWVN